MVVFSDVTYLFQMCCKTCYPVVSGNNDLPIMSTHKLGMIDSCCSLVVISSVFSFSLFSVMIPVG